MQDYTSGGTQCVIDSGCTNHMAADMLVEFVDALKSSSNIKVLVVLVKVVISSDASLLKVMLVQSLHYNLLSTVQLACVGYDSHSVNFI